MFLALVIVAAVVIVGGSLALRDSGGTSAAQTGGSKAAGAASPAASPAVSQTVASAGAKPQICASCWGDGGPDPTVGGQAQIENGVQVVRVGLQGGYYVPNEFTVKAGVPVTVVFSGSAKGCLAAPEFPDLGLKGDLSTGTATLELGTLGPGSYAFTCSMGVNEGHITVQ
jgi:hypothetical protein